MTTTGVPKSSSTCRRFLSPVTIRIHHSYSFNTFTSSQFSTPPSLLRPLLPFTVRTEVPFSVLCFLTFQSTRQFPPLIDHFNRSYSIPFSHTLPFRTTKSLRVPPDFPYRQRPHLHQSRWVWLLFLLRPTCHDLIRPGIDLSFLTCLPPAPFHLFSLLFHLSTTGLSSSWCHHHHHLTSTLSRVWLPTHSLSTTTHCRKSLNRQYVSYRRHQTGTTTSSDASIGIFPLRNLFDTNLSMLVRRDQART